MQPRASVMQDLFLTIYHINAKMSTNALNIFVHKTARTRSAVFSAAALRVTS
ncbi:hypothetical protein DPMN_089830 [Dreissena polymorpha]|uniref:Uncharacterized protein n=1 Tax=Dreissena polymorpha TaxID=45954 RepID=A0A9D4KX25_DREPO|nr:hypothetical protein DPMN_089830 [Dreissena polymorpha]